MATTQNTFTGNGSNLGPFSFTFKWLESTDIKVSVGGVLKTAGTHYNLQSLNYTTKTGGQVLFTAGNAPANGASIRIFRDTDDDALSAVFSSGSAIRAKDLNDNFTQNLYVTQEVNNNALNVDGSNPMVGNLNMNGYQIDNLGEPTSDSDAATKKYIDDRYGNLSIPGFTRWSKTAVGGETTLSGAGTTGGTLGYSPNREQVYLNGAQLQRDADYTANNGTSIVLNVALIAGDVLEVICVNNLNTGTTAQAQDVYWNQSGSSAVTRTVESKLRDVVSVKDFGAVGNGVTDDTAAIQAAISALSSRATIYFPRGIYSVSDTIIVSGEHIEITGDGGLGGGSIIRGAAGLSNKTLFSVSAFCFNLNNISLESFNATNAKAVELLGSINNGLDYISKCFLGGWDTAITVRTDTYNVTGCWALNCGTFVKGANSAINGIISQNYVQGGLTSVNLTRDISAPLPQMSEGVRITNNSFLNTSASAKAIIIEAGLEIYVTDNIIDQTGTNGTGIEIIPTQSGSNVSHVRILNNWIDGGDSSGGGCLIVNGATRPVDFLWIEQNTFVTDDGLKPVINLNTVNTYWVVNNSLLSAHTGSILSTPGSANGHVFGNRSRLTPAPSFENNSPRTGITVPAAPGISAGKTDGTLPGTFSADYTTGLVPVYEARCGDNTDFSRLRVTYNNSGTPSGIHKAYGYSLSLDRGGSVGAQGGLTIGTEENNAGPLYFVVRGLSAGRFNADCSLALKTDGQPEVLIYTLNADPNGTISAPPGSLCLRTNGTTGGLLYVKESGIGNTGWVAK